MCTAESHSTQPVDLPVAWKADVTSFLYKRNLNIVRYNIVNLQSYLEVCSDIGQFVRPIRTASRIGIIQPDVVDVEAVRDIIVDPRAGLDTSPHSTGSTYILFLDSATVPIISSHSVSFTGSLSVILLSLAMQPSVSDFALL
jgi:hypothetical protein